MPTYTAKSSAMRAARNVLGPEAAEAVDFHLSKIDSEQGRRWKWTRKPTIQAEKRAAGSIQDNTAGNPP